MKFRLATGRGSQSGGLTLYLYDEAGDIVGSVSSSFISNYHPFSSNTRASSVTAKAVIFDMRTGRAEVIDEMEPRDCFRRKEADQTFRKWMDDKVIRSRMIDAAQLFRHLGKHEPG